MEELNLSQEKEFEGIITFDDYNPTLSSPNSPFDISFYQTRATLMDTEEYKRFLDNSIRRFRSSKTYTNYKSFLYGLGLNKCQVHGNINSEMVDLEMHHNIITIFDIALIICEHVINTKGYISTFDLVALLREEHINHRVQLVMLSETPHELYHNTEGVVMQPNKCFKWGEFLYNYRYGITLDVAYKLARNIESCIKLEGKHDYKELLDLRKNIVDWSVLNDQMFNRKL